MLRVRDLLDEFPLEVVAGERSLDAEVRGVQVSDLSDPTPWLSRGELLLTGGPQLDEQRGFDDYVARLAAKDVSGLGMAATSRLDTSQRGFLSDAAGEAGLPLLVIPPDVPFIALGRAVAKRTAGEREDRLARTQFLQDALEQGARANPGIAPLVGALARALAATVLICDGVGRPLVSSDARNLLQPRFLNVVGRKIRAREGSDSGPLTISPGGRGAGATGLPVPWDGRNGGEGSSAEASANVWLLVVREPGPRADDDLLALRQAAPLVALELLRRRLARTHERQLASEALAAILRRDEPAEEVERRLAAYELTDVVATIILQVPEQNGGSRARAESTLTASLRRESATGLVGSSGSLAVALIPGLPDDQLFALAERLGIGIASTVGSTVSLGVGRAVPAAEAASSIDEARYALQAMSMATRDGAGSSPDPLEPTARVATFKDLGSHQLLLALQNHEALSRFCDSILGPIEAMESNYGGELLHSLQVFIETNGQWERAARQLFCHRHTLRYRIRKIEELTGRDLESATDRIDFYLALRARTMLF